MNSRLDKDSKIKAAATLPNNPAVANDSNDPNDDNYHWNDGSPLIIDITDNFNLWSSLEHFW